MNQFPSTRRLGLAALLGGIALCPLLPAGAGRAGTASSSTPALSAAVRFAREAAETVLERGGAESCLRGKLTKALLGLSSSCAAAGERSPLCILADRAVVVTPMSLAFMDATARELLELSALAQPARPGAVAPSP